MMMRPKPELPVSPTGQSGKIMIGIRGLLEWAFATECAQLDYDEVEASAGGRASGVGMEYRLMQQMALAKRRGECVRVDISVGRSYPQDDAELVATIVRNTLDWRDAVRVVELARLCRVPDWNANPQPQCRPVAIRGSKHGPKAVREFWTGQGRWVGVALGRDGGYACPVIYSDTAKDIGRMRRDYLDWWGHLLWVNAALKSCELSRFELSDRMPPMEPWKKRLANLSNC